MKQPLSGRTVGVLGLARSGLAAARLALARGASVYASDLGDGPAQREAAERVRELGGAAEAGRHDPDRLRACDVVVLSPGIPPGAGILNDPALREAEVVPEVEFAYSLLDAPVIAVTGTNGKTTVTGLIEHVLRAAGVDAVAGGNIGTALSEVALREPAPEWAVVEVSSFQLSRVRAFAPRVGVLTNLAPDHLDWYPDVEAYYADKANLFRNATDESLWVLNGEDAHPRALPGDAPGRRFFFRAESEPEPGEAGGHVSADGWLTLRLGPDAEERLLAAEELRILGPHNAANALAAALAARLAGAAPEGIAEGLRTFRAPAHRLEPVAERGGVLWINDSKSTNIASTRVAVRSTGRPTVLLLGGRHKGEPYTELLPDLRDRVRAVVAFGEAGAIVERDLAPHVPVAREDGPFEAVVRRAAALAEPGDVVLLSPACSSFDMFRDYEARGRRFTELAREAA